MAIDPSPLHHAYNPLPVAAGPAPCADCMLPASEHEIEGVRIDVSVSDEIETVHVDADRVVRGSTLVLDNGQRLDIDFEMETQTIVVAWTDVLDVVHVWRGALADGAPTVKPVRREGGGYDVLVLRAEG